MKILNVSSLLVVGSLALSGCVNKTESLADNDRINTLMTEKQDVVNRCYQDAVEKNPNVGTGELSIRAERRPDGFITLPRQINGFPGSHSVYECIADDMKDWKLETFYNRGPINFIWNLEKYEN